MLIHVPRFSIVLESITSKNYCTEKLTSPRSTHVTLMAIPGKVPNEMGLNHVTLASSSTALNNLPFIKLEINDYTVGCPLVCIVTCSGGGGIFLAEFHFYEVLEFSAIV